MVLVWAFGFGQTALCAADPAMQAVATNADVDSSSGITVVNPWTYVVRKELGFETSPHERTRPVVVGDILYFASVAGRVVALHRLESYPFWEKDLKFGVDGALAYGRSKLFVGDLSGNLSALEARDGTSAWNFKINNEWLAAPLVLRDRVYVPSSSDDLYALQEKDGKEIWHFSHRGDEKMTIRGTASTTGLASGAQIVQGFSDGYVASLTGDQGKLIWPEKKLRRLGRFYDIDSPAYIDDKIIIVGTYDGTVYSLDRMSGDTNWTFGVGSYSGFLVEDNVVYFSGLNGFFYALDKTTGGVKWKTPFEKGVGMTPVRAGDYLVITTSDDPVYVIDPKNGKVVWTQALGAGTFAPATAHPDGRFYCMSNFGNLYAFEIKKSAGWKGGPEPLKAPSAFFRPQMQ